MPDPVRKTIWVAGCSHHTAPLEVREHLCLKGEDEAELSRAITSLAGIDECLVLGTCNRIEVYLAGEEDSILQARSAFVETLHTRTGGRVPEVYERKGVDVVAHLICVCSGLDSQMVGETEVLGQVKAAYAQADQRRSLGPCFHRLFQKAFQSSKWLRSHTEIGSGQTTIGAVAVDLAERIFEGLTGSRVLVLGSGEVGESTARALRSRGVGSITVSSRTLSHAHQLAEMVGASILPFSDWHLHLAEFDIALASTSAPETILSRAMVAASMHHRPHRPLFLIDLAVPRDIDPEAADVPNVYLYNLDDLAAIANENLGHRLKEVEKCRHWIERRACELWPRICPARDL